MSTGEEYLTSIYPITPISIFIYPPEHTFIEACFLHAGMSTPGFDDTGPLMVPGRGPAHVALYCDIWRSFPDAKEETARPVMHSIYAGIFCLPPYWGPL